jgi:DNA helicase-2/ATP-dependent DNA helicase PcrA
MATELNPPQKMAVDTLSGPLLVLAGAGTGKTRVVTFRIANLIRNGIRPDRILAVTFTNKAAQEMQERVGHQLGYSRQKKRKRGEKAAPRPLIGTFHSVCVQILKRHADRLGYPLKFTIYDRGDQESVARSTLRDLRVHDESLKPADFLGIIGRWKNAGVRPERALEVANNDKEHLAASGFRRYQKSLKLAGAMDFDDLLLNTEELLTKFPDVKAAESGLFDHVLVDEYQDTNGAQYRIIRELTIGHRNLCVVGDDDQSIYGWRGAEVRHILNFRGDWPEATVVRLEDNYRSTHSIIETANTLIQFNKERHDKVLRAARAAGSKPRVLQFNKESDEAEGIVNEIAMRLKNDPSIEPRDFAILFRTNEQPRIFEMHLRKAELPYVLTGTQSFFDRKEVRDLLSYLRFIDTPTDEVALRRIINVPPRGLGTKTIEILLDHAVKKGVSIWESANTKDVYNSLTGPAQRGIDKLRSLVDESQNALNEGINPSDVMRQMIERISYGDELYRNYPNPEDREMRESTIEEACNALALYETSNDDPSLGGFLSEVALAGKEFGSPKEQKQRANAISLMTYHSAKGLEFPICYMIGMEEGLLPHRRSIADGGGEVDEERRLCYVGVTRARDELSLSLALTRLKWGKPRETHPSRFLYEMTGQADNPNKMKAIQGALKEIRKPTLRKPKMRKRNA